MTRCCPCCGHLTFNDEHGTYDICPVCYWEDDPVQEKDISYSGGANGVCLSDARKNYKKYGACEERSIASVRKPKPEELTDEIRKRGLIEIAKSMINHKIDLILGCRQICSIAVELDDEIYKSDIFGGFCAIESETDIYPLGDDRKYYNKKYLAELDQKLNAYIDRCSESIIEDSHKLIKFLEHNL